MTRTLMGILAPAAHDTPASESLADDLVHQIETRAASIAVIGQGYVGLSLASAAAEAGFSVVGNDQDRAKVASLNAGACAAPGVDPSLFTRALATDRLRFSAEPDAIASARVVFICVPTPVIDHAPDLRHVESAAASVASSIRPGSLVILESTTFPGTTDGVVRPILERSGLRDGVDLLLAYSPERIDPGNARFGMRNTPRVVGGTTPQATRVASRFYAQIVDQVVAVADSRAAEMAKLLENTFRHVNIALINELAVFCHDLGVDVWEVIDAAASKPFGFMPFYPGPGVGGHCIPVDPTYLAWQVRRTTGRRFGLLDEAQDINDRMPSHIVERVRDLLNDRRKPLSGSRVLVLGVTYKPDVADLRESPALPIVSLLLEKGVDVSFHDPFIDALEVDGTVLSRAELDRGLAEADLVVLLAPHATYPLASIAERCSLVFDARNAFGTDAPPNVVRL
jgi:UDP-N-acetyl-D-glucosamine dehydrogenase